jgi:hypothetical protein
MPDWSYLYNESPMRVDGQVVRATIDGMSVPISMAMNRLQNGSAIPESLAPYQHMEGFRFESVGVGLFNITVPGYRHITPDGSSDDEVIRVGSYVDHPAQTFLVYFGGNWNVSVAVDDDIIPLPNLETASDVLLNNRDCAIFIENLINQVATKDNPFTSDSFQQIRTSVTVDFSVQTGTVNGKPNQRVAGKAYPRDAITGIAKIGISPSQISKSGATEYGYAKAVYDYVITYMHEVIHQAGSNRRYTDRELAVAAVNPTIVNGDPAYKLPEGALEEFNSLNKDSKGENSRFYDKLLQYYCPGPSILGKPKFGKIR